VKESDILHENGRFWVCKIRGAYHVMRPHQCASITDSAYRLDADGLSIAKARCDYLARRENNRD